MATADCFQINSLTQEKTVFVAIISDDNILIRDNDVVFITYVVKWTLILLIYTVEQKVFSLCVHCSE